MIKQNIKFIILLTFATIFCGAQESLNQFDANGKRHGVWKKTFEGTNVLRYEGEFHHGKEIGLFKFYKNIRKQAVLTATKQFNKNDNSAYSYTRTKSSKPAYYHSAAPIRFQYHVLIVATLP